MKWQDCISVDPMVCHGKACVKGTRIMVSVVSGATYCDNYTGYTIQPKVQYKSNFNYGLKCDSIVLVVDSGLTIDNQTTDDNIESYISGGTISGKSVCDLNVGEYVLSASYKQCTEYSHQQIVNGPVSGYSFTYNYQKLEITDIECLASIKKSIITGLTQNNTYQSVFQNLVNFFQEAKDIFSVSIPRDELQKSISR